MAILCHWLTLNLSHIHFTIFSEVITINIEGRWAIIFQILYSLFHLHEFAMRQRALLPWALVAASAVHLWRSPFVILKKWRSSQKVRLGAHWHTNLSPFESFPRGRHWILFSTEKAFIMFIKADAAVIIVQSRKAALLSCLTRMFEQSDIWRQRWVHFTSRYFDFTRW